MADKIKLNGLLSEGYGIIPKKLMRMNIHNNVKLLMAYLLSFTGKGNECFPSYNTIAKDLKWSKSTVSRNIKNAVFEGLLLIEKQDKGFKRANRYTILLDGGTQCSTTRSTHCSTTDSTQCSTDGSTQCSTVLITDNNNNVNNINEEIEKVYKAYPVKCPIKNTYTQKNSKCKLKIKNLLTKEGKTIDELLFIIKKYVDENIKVGRWIKNFYTFLNNLPDYSEEEEIESGGLCEAEKEFFAEQEKKKREAC